MKTETKGLFPPTMFPAIRARMGDRWYYIGAMTFGEIAKCVQPVDEIHEKAELKTWIQRELRPERTAQIAAYLQTQAQRFFNAIVLGVYRGDPEWLAVALAENVRIKGFELDERQMNAFGMVHLSGNESIFAIDGQHRVEGIRAAVTNDRALAGEEQTVIFIAHNTTDEGRERTRRLFSTLNSFAKPVAESELVALSEDDAFAKATRNLIENYSGLGMRFVPLLPTPNIPAHEKACVTTVVGLYQLTQFLAPLDIRKAKKKHKVGPPSNDVLAAVLKETTDFWDALKKHIPAIRSVLASDPKKEMAGRYRTTDGGHLLFRPVGMKSFARAARTLMDRGDSADAAVEKLSHLPLDLDAEIWQEVLWRPETRTMLTKYVRLAQNVMLHELGAQPDSKKYSVTKEYERITGRNYPKRK